MIHCLVCCQSFHSFCAGFKGQDSFTCPGCVTCRVCGRGNDVSHTHPHYRPLSVYCVSYVTLTTAPSVYTVCRMWLSLPPPQCVLCAVCDPHTPSLPPPQCVLCVVCDPHTPSLPPPQCVLCAVCGAWFHKRCLTSDHRSTTLKGDWRCVSCTKCRSCKTTTPNGVWLEDFTYCKSCYSLKAKGKGAWWIGVWFTCQWVWFHTQVTSARCVASAILTQTTTRR